MKHEMTQLKCFVPDTPIFVTICYLMWSSLVKLNRSSIIITMDTRPPERLEMVSVDLCSSVSCPYLATCGTVTLPVHISDQVTFPVSSDNC